VELTIHERIDDHFTLKYGVLGINNRSISNCAQYVTPDSKIKWLKFSCFPFGNPTNKTETGTAYTLGTTNSKAPGPIIVIDQSEILSRSHVQFITLSLGGAQLCCAIYQPLQSARIWSRKTIFLS
jgi:hypothetical protein